MILQPPPPPPTDPTYIFFLTFSLINFLVAVEVCGDILVHVVGAEVQAGPVVVDVHVAHPLLAVRLLHAGGFVSMSFSWTIRLRRHLCMCVFFVIFFLNEKGYLNCLGEKVYIVFFCEGKLVFWISLFSGSLALVSAKCPNGGLGRYWPMRWRPQRVWNNVVPRQLHFNRFFRSQENMEPFKIIFSRWLFSEIVGKGHNKI